MSTALTFMENNIFVFWADPDIKSTMSENRKKCYQSLVEHSGCKITLINKNNFFDYEVSGSEIHKGFKYLSDVHKSDYARGYLMYHHGGGYTDIKQCDFSWREYFDQLKNSDADFISYAERREQDCSYYLAKPNYFNIGGNGMFIFKKQTVTGKAWRDGVEEIMDRIYNKLVDHPGTYHPRAVTGGIIDGKRFRGSQYPLRWEELQSEVFHKVQYENPGRAILTMPFINIESYR